LRRGLFVLLRPFCGDCGARFSNDNLGVEGLHVALLFAKDACLAAAADVAVEGREKGSDESLLSADILDSEKYFVSFS